MAGRELTRAEPRSRRRFLSAPSGRVLTLALVLATAALALFWGPVAGVGDPPGPHRLNWWALALLFAGAEVFVMHLQFRREAHSISLSEVPLVFGLLFASPTALVTGYLVGSGLALALHRRQPPLKLVFNLSHFALESAVGILVFNAILPNGAELGPTLWLAVGLAAISVDLVAAASVSGAISLHQGTLHRRQLSEVFGAGTGVGAINTVLALIGGTVVWVDIRSVWLLVALAIVVVACYRGYASLRERHASLELLYEFTRAVSRSHRAEDVMLAVLSQARILLRAEAAELVFLAPPGSEEPAHHVRMGTNDEVATHEDSCPLPGLLTGGRHEKPVVIPKTARDIALRRRLNAHGIEDCVVAPLHGESGVVGVIAVANRMGDVSTFGEDDARLFETIANHASVALENGRLIDRLRHEALHDALTGLPNRTLFHDRVDKTIGRRRRADARGAVMLLDLDRFKEVNDSLGHHTGDLVLQEVSARLREALGPEATIARLGGDEFAVMVPDVLDGAAASGIARQIREGIQRPFPHGELSLVIGATVGIALAPQHGADSSTLLRHADVAMYAAKGSPLGIALYSVELDDHSPRRLALVGELRDAITTGALSVHYQPKAELETSAVVGVEALVRWLHPVDGNIPPDDFIPLAERTGLIAPLTTFMLHQSLWQCRRWQDAGIRLPVAVNLSARSLVDLDLPGEVGHLLAEAGVPAEMLTLEVTESSVMSDPARTIGVLAALRELGVSISVDDFGTGYSSLSYLKRLPVNEVKIDKSFVVNLTTDHNDASIVRSIVDLGRNLGLRVVAEGVEDEATWQQLASLGCDLAQGYYLSRPLPAEDITSWVGQLAAVPR